MAYKQDALRRKSNLFTANMRRLGMVFVVNRKINRKQMHYEYRLSMAK